MSINFQDLKARGVKPPKAKNTSPQNMDEARAKVSKDIDNQISKAKAHSADGTKPNACWYQEDEPNSWSVSIKYGNRYLYRSPEEELSKQPYIGPLDNLNQVVEAYESIKDGVTHGVFNTSIEKAWNIAMEKGKELAASRRNK